MCQQFWKIDGWQNKLSTIWKGPGWQPGTPRLGNDDFPKVEYPIHVYDPKMSTFLSLYTFVHFAYVIVQYSAVLKDSKVRSMETASSKGRSISFLELFHCGSSTVLNHFTLHSINVRCYFRSQVRIFPFLPFVSRILITSTVWFRPHALTLERIRLALMLILPQLTLIKSLFLLQTHVAVQSGIVLSLIATFLVTPRTLQKSKQQ